VLDVDRDLALRIKLLVLDVDGVLTDGHLVLGPTGEELKTFSVQDGIGIKLAQEAGIEVAFLSARTSEIVEKRAAMLAVTEVHQGERRKLPVVKEIGDRLGIDLSEIAYVGDDIVDLAPVAAVGMGVAVGDACQDLKEVASHTATLPGGGGAVRETVEAILRSRGVWKDAVRGFLESAR